MGEGGQPSRIETILYDAEWNRTEDESLAVLGEIMELDGAGRALAKHGHDGLDRQVDPKSLEGDEGELPTRPPRSGADARTLAGRSLSSAFSPSLLDSARTSPTAQTRELVLERELPLHTLCLWLGSVVVFGSLHRPAHADAPQG